MHGNAKPVHRRLHFAYFTTQVSTADLLFYTDVCISAWCSARYALPDYSDWGTAMMFGTVFAASDSNPTLSRLKGTGANPGLITTTMAESIKDFMIVRNTRCLMSWTCSTSTSRAWLPVARLFSMCCMRQLSRPKVFSGGAFANLGALRVLRLYRMGMLR